MLPWRVQDWLRVCWLWACASLAYLAEHDQPGHPRDLAQDKCLVFRVRDRIYDRWYFELIAALATPINVTVSGPERVNDFASPLNK